MSEYKTLNIGLIHRDSKYSSRYSVECVRRLERIDSKILLIYSVFVKTVSEYKTTLNIGLIHRVMRDSK